MLGSRMIGVTYPLLAATITESPAWIGWAMFASTAPGLLWHLPAGALVDRLGPRRVMVWSEATRAALVAGLCALLLLDSLGIMLLLAIALAEGVLSVNSSVAEITLIPTTVTPDKVEKALAMHETSVQGMVLAGRPLGGFLYGLAPVVPFAANALMFAWAALALRAPDPGPAGPAPAKDEPRGTWGAEMRAGLTELWQNRFLRSATLITAFTNLMVHGMIVVFLTEATNAGMPPALAGTILAASGVGGMLGALVSTRRQMILNRARRYGRAAPAAGWLGLARRHRSMMHLHLWACTAALALPLLSGRPPASFALALFVVGLAGGLSNVTIRTVLSRVPADRGARVAAVSRLGSYSAVALGPLLAGLFVGEVASGAVLAFLWGAMAALAIAMTAVPSWRGTLTSSRPHPAVRPSAVAGS